MGPEVNTNYREVPPLLIKPKELKPFGSISKMPEWKLQGPEVLVNKEQPVISEAGQKASAMQKMENADPTSQALQKPEVAGMLAQFLTKHDSYVKSTKGQNDDRTETVSNPLMAGLNEFKGSFAPKVPTYQNGGETLAA